MEKLNIAEILKDCPRGMELDCTMYEDVYFEYVDELQIIHCYIERKLCKTSITFNQYGTPNSDVKSKCVIFPKGKTTWDGFHRPFKDGDIIYNPNIKAVGIFNKQTDDKTISHCFINIYNQLRICHYHSKFLDDWRFATEEEKLRLFFVIKENGYKWNPETKTLEKLKKDKFDITTLKPFDKVLVRQCDIDCWRPALWGRSTTNKNFPFITSFGVTSRAIPFKNNEWLVGTTDDCDDYYKTWK